MNPNDTNGSTLRHRSLSLLMAGTLMGAAVAVAQQKPGRIAPAGLPVRFTEGSVHGFLEMRAVGGAILAHGDLLQVAKDGTVEVRMVFHFLDASFLDEKVSYTQHGVFAMQNYHLVQTGPAFANDIDVTLSHTGDYVVNETTHKEHEKHRYAGKLDLPPDVYNGMIITIAKNVAVHDTQTVHYVAWTPKPQLVGLQFSPTPAARMLMGRQSEAATKFTIHPKLGALMGTLAKVFGKTPPDNYAWIVEDEVPAFVRFEGALFTNGPIWQLNLTTPQWPK